MDTLKPPRRLMDRVAWIILAMALAFSVFVRWRLAEFPLERDEGEYAYTGQLILQGFPPYSLAYNMKLPGTYLAYAGIMAIFGQTTTGIHLGLLAVNLVTIGLIFFFARELFDSMTAAVAAVSYSVLSTSPSVLGMAAHATHFVAFFGVAGVWLLWRAIRLDKTLLFFAAGLLLGLAFLMKQQGVFLPCFGGMVVLHSFVWQRPFLSRRHLTIFMNYTAGVVLPFAAVFLWLWLAGTFDKFWFWTVQYARFYVVQMSRNEAMQLFWFNIKRVLTANWPLWVMAIIGAFSLARSKGISRRREFVFAFLVFSFLCVCPGFYFREHYFIVLLPCIAILSGVGSVAFVDAAFRFPIAPRPQATSHRSGPNKSKAKTLAQAGKPDPIGRGLLVGLVAMIPTVAIVFPVWQQREHYFLRSPQEACRSIYGSNPFIECPIIADYIRNHSRLDDRIAVLGSEPEIYFYASRISATGYIYTYALMESHPFARMMQDDMIKQIESSKPEFLVFVHTATSWLLRLDSDTHIFEWINSYTAANYHPVGLVEMISDDYTQYKWGAKVARAQPRVKDHIWIYKRK